MVTPFRRVVRVWREMRSAAGACGRQFAWLAVVGAALLVPGAAQSAALTNVGPRLPVSIGPRPSLPIGTVGPRLDPHFHGIGSGYIDPGGSTVSPNGGTAAGASSGGPGRKKPHQAERRTNSGVPPSGERRYVPDEVVFELKGNPSNRQITALFTRFHLAQLDARRIPLVNSTFYRARILDGSSVPTKIRALEANAAIRTAQPNYLFTLTQMPESAPAAPVAATAADPAQYAIAKLRLDQAHRLAHGDRVLVAVVDSGIDASHPALTGIIEKSFDALNAKDGPHTHGTAIAGIIAGHDRLDGAAPGVRILAARAFSATQGSTVSIMASIDWAIAQGARVINMSFAGPSDPALGRVLAAAHQKRAVLVAASGNAGPKSPPLWPAADPHVIAVTATDYDDRLFAMANRGSHVAIAAPGVDILVANPGTGYRMESGTSFAAAFVSGVAALLIERKDDLSPEAVKKALLATAHDLGPKGRDDQFGAGLMDAFEAVNMVAKPADAALQVPAH